MFFLVEPSPWVDILDDTQNKKVLFRARFQGNQVWTRSLNAESHIYIYINICLNIIQNMYIQTFQSGQLYQYPDMIDNHNHHIIVIQNKLQSSSNNHYRIIIQSSCCCCHGKWPIIDDLPKKKTSIHSGFSMAMFYDQMAML